VPASAGDPAEASASSACVGLSTAISTGLRLSFAAFAAKAHSQAAARTPSVSRLDFTDSALPASGLVAGRLIDALAAIQNETCLMTSTSRIVHP
jgi:hypothetical protein